MPQKSNQWVWQDECWPNFTWDSNELANVLSQARFKQGKLLGSLQMMDADARADINSQLLSDELMNSSAIEGVQLDRHSVRSSIARRLGLDQAGISVKLDRYIEGSLDMILDAVGQHDQALTLERLYGWQAALFPTGYSGIQKVLVGSLRGKGDMQIISGSFNQPQVHYVAPPHEILPQEMKRFLQWFNKESFAVDGLLRAGIAHLWFEILHPFDDGNGRVGRAILDRALAQDEGSSTRFYSLSSQMMMCRKDYYQAIENHSLDLTGWLTWFLGCFIGSIDQANEKIKAIMAKTRFWQNHQAVDLSSRQSKAINLMLRHYPKVFEGGMTTKKYMHLNKVSRATAYRELHDLVQKKCLEAMGTSGRNVAYRLLE